MAEVAHELFGSPKGPLAAPKGPPGVPSIPLLGSHSAVMLVPLMGPGTAPCPPGLVAAAPGAELPVGCGAVPQVPVLSQSRTGAQKVKKKTQNFPFPAARVSSRLPHVQPLSIWYNEAQSRAQSIVQG